MTFRGYNQRQTALFPHSFDDLIPSSHPVQVIEQLNFKETFGSAVVNQLEQVTADAGYGSEKTMII